MIASGVPTRSKSPHIAPSSPSTPSKSERGARAQRAPLAGKAEVGGLADRERSAIPRSHLRVPPSAGPPERGGGNAEVGIKQIRSALRVLRSAFDRGARSAS